MLVSKGKGKVSFKKDWDAKFLSSNFDPLRSFKLMLPKSATQIQGVLLEELTDRCFSRIINRAKQPT